MGLRWYLGLPAALSALHGGPGQNMEWDALPVWSLAREVLALVPQKLNAKLLQNNT